MAMARADANGMSKWKFGEIYKRLHSTTAEGKNHETHRSYRRRNSTELPMPSTSTTIPSSQPTPRNEPLFIGKRLKEFISQDDAITFEPIIPTHGPHQPLANRRGPHSGKIFKLGDGGPASKLPYPHSSRVPDKNVNQLRKHQPVKDVVESAATAMTSRILEHERLCRALTIEIFKRVKARGAGREEFEDLQTVSSDTVNNPKSRELLDDERSRGDVAMLKKTLKFVSSFYYEKAPALNDSSDTSPVDPPGSSDVLYKPPFPSYTSLEEPTELNRYLYGLFIMRPPPAFLLPKVCFNLLTSSNPPDIKTYNILIQGFTRLRQNSLAHTVFRNLVEGGLGLGKAGGPDPYTLAAALNLCVKSADYEGFRRIANIITQQNKKSQPRFKSPRRRHKIVLQALISGAAKFGEVGQVIVYLRALKRECPLSPRLGVVGLTSLLRLWTENKDWEKGLKVWREIRWLDTRAQKGEGGEAIDARSIHQMLELCKECRKTKVYAEILELGVKRGWDEAMLVKAQEKTKALHVRRENKTPDLRRPHIKSSVDKEFLGALRQVWSSNLSYMDRLEAIKDTYGGSIDSEDLDEVPISSAGLPNTHPKKSASSHKLRDSTKAKVFKRVISHRLITSNLGPEKEMVKWFGPEMYSIRGTGDLATKVYL